MSVVKDFFEDLVVLIKLPQGILLDLVHVKFGAFAFRDFGRSIKRGKTLLGCAYPRGFTFLKPSKTEGDVCCRFCGELAGDLEALELIRNPSFREPCCRDKHKTEKGSDQKEKKKVDDETFC